MDTARRRWRFDTSIFRVQKVDPSTNTLAMGTNMFRDPFLDQFFGNFLNLWKPPNWRSWRHDRNKSAIWGFFGDNSQCIYDQCILCFWPFLNNQLRFALLPCTVYLVFLCPNKKKHRMKKNTHFRFFRTFYFSQNVRDFHQNAGKFSRFAFLLGKFSKNGPKKWHEPNFRRL